jgi:hypothetical protein
MTKPMLINIKFFERFGKTSNKKVTHAGDLPAQLRMKIKYFQGSFLNLSKNFILISLGFGILFQKVFVSSKLTFLKPSIALQDRIEL